MLDIVPKSMSLTTQDAEVTRTGGDRVRLWQSHCEDANRHLNSGQHRKARQKLRAALREATHFGDHDERLAVTLLNLIACEVELKDGELTSEAALQLAEFAIHVHKNCHGRDSEETASCLLNVGVLLELSDHIQQANEALEEAIAITRRLEVQSKRVTTLRCHALYNRAALLWSCDQVQTDKAAILAMVEEALKIGEQIYGGKDGLVITMRQLRNDIRNDHR
ncbi:MAG TPA: tetratricopeptide repeat protein [Candidatus Obscuribacterales bacterium]